MSLLGLGEANLLEFFSANSQIFGALLGLVGLSYVRVSETIEQNVNQLLTALVNDFIDELIKDEKVHADELQLEIDNEGLGKLIDRYRETVGETRHRQFKTRYAAILQEMEAKRKLTVKFRVNCWSSLFLISLSMIGLVLPTSRFMGQIEIFALLLLALSVVVLVEMVLFFLTVANTKVVLVFGRK